MSDTGAVSAALALDGLGGDARAGFEVAANAGYSGIALATNHPELNPEALGETARRHVRNILNSKGLGVASIRAAAPRGGLSDAATIDRTMDNARKAMLLARELGVGTVAMHVGMLGKKPEGGGVPEGTMVSALRELAQQADAAGVMLAVGAESADGTTGESLARLLKEVDFDGARALLDTGRAIGSGDDPVKAAELLAMISAHGGIGQVTAADAVRAGSRVRAAALGEGQLAIVDLMAMLREAGFGGPLVVDVRELAYPVEGAAKAAAILKTLQRR